MTDSSRPAQSREGDGVTVESLATTKLLPASFLEGLGVRNLQGGSVAIEYGNGARTRVRKTVSAKGSLWAKNENRRILPYGLFKNQVEAVAQAGYLIIAEGESDCWTLWHHGYPALGIPGVSMVKQLEIDHLLDAEKLYVVSEPDKAGGQFPADVAAWTTKLWAESGAPPLAEMPKIFRLVMPNGVKDPADLHLSVSGDQEQFTRLLEAAVADADLLTAEEVTARQLVSANNTNNANEVWDPPIPFHHFDPPAFPTHVLPGWMSAYVEAEAIATQTPPDLAGMLALSAVAVAVAKQFVVVVRDGWRESLNIYSVVVMPSGSRKSAVFRDVTAPIETEERTQMELVGMDIVIAKEQKNLMEGDLRDIRRKIGKGECQPQDAFDAVEALEQFEVPAPPRLIADDVTAEKLEVLLLDHGGRIGLFAPEGDVFDVMAGRYASSGVLNLGVFLKGHAGDTIRVDRVGRSSVVVHDPAVTMGLAVQPDVIEGLASRRQFRGRGLVNRFLYALPESNIGRRNVDPPTVEYRVRSTFEAHLHNLLRPDQATELTLDQTPISLTDDAHETLMTFSEEVELQLGPSGRLSDISEWGSKLAGAVVRIAGLLHLADHDTDPEQQTEPIPKGTIERAITVGEYLVPHAKAAFTLMGLDPAVADAQHMVKWIAAKGLTEFTMRELFEGVKGRFKKVDNLLPGLELLEQHYYIRHRPEEPRTGPGRPPSPTFDVNPHTHSQYSQYSHKTLPELPENLDGEDGGE